ncbi:MBL fold metallo-hydrolase [Nocardia sp. NPDC004711]
MLLVGGPTLMIEFGGVRLLTDPTFDPPGEHPIDPAGTRVLTKTTGPAVPPEQIGSIDAVLLSHDQHPDNLDDTGRKLLAGVPAVFTTPSAADRLGGTARGLSPWRHAQLRGSDGRQVRITAVPAHHGPEGTEHALGEVTGFVLAGDGLPRVYVSGDNSSLDVVAQIAHHLGPVEIAVLFAGAGRTGLFDAYLNLTSRQAAQAARILDVRAAIVAHTEGWAHLTEGPDTITGAFASEGQQHRLLPLAPGQTVLL